MQITEQIKAWGELHLPADVYVVDAVFKPGGKKLSVFLDSDNSLTIETCRQFNKVLSELLDTIDFTSEAYTLEVSSPGVDKPLLMFRQYPKHIGREIQVRLKAQTVLLGKLIAIEEETLVFHLKHAKKGYNNKEQTEVRVPFSEIEEAIVQVSFNG